MSKQCIAFLNEFCAEFTQNCSLENVSLPFDIVRSVLLKDEVEGQCIDWVLSFLSKRCSISLIYNIYIEYVLFIYLFCTKYYFLFGPLD